RIRSRLIGKHDRIATSTLPNAYEYSKQIQKRTILQRIRGKCLRILIGKYINKESDLKQEFLKNRNQQLEMFSYPDSDTDITTDYQYLEF
ncbi:MAG: hypothetical protein QM751_12755, partial [Paludibacteraceae bacterium]